MKQKPGRSALIVVDVQNDFCPGGTLAVPEGDAVIDPINRLCRRFDVVAATQDWHPRGHLSFASSWEGKAPYDTVELGGGTQVLWPEHCVQGSPGAAFHPALEIDAATLIQRKGARRELDSYSALFENDRITPTGLEGWLRSLGVGRLYLTGLASDYCVFYSAQDALSRGFEVFVVTDAVRGVDFPAGNIDRAFAELERAGARFVESRELEGRIR